MSIGIVVHNLEARCQVDEHDKDDLNRAVTIQVDQNENEDESPDEVHDH